MKDYQAKRTHRKRRTPERVPPGFFDAFDRLYGRSKSPRLSEQLDNLPGAVK